eukprot:scaffold109726_cov65-Phaeocystis_antarctica.AAC.1
MGSGDGDDRSSNGVSSRMTLSSGSSAGGSGAETSTAAPRCEEGNLARIVVRCLSPRLSCRLQSARLRCTTLGGGA